MQRNDVYDLHKRKYITHRQKIYLDGPDTPRERLFYLLPKINKAPESWAPFPESVVSLSGS